MDSFIPDSIRESAPRHATRLDLVSATRRSQALAWADAVQKRGQLFTAMDDFLRALRGLQAEGACNLFLEDCAVGALIQASNLQHAIDKDLDQEHLVASEPLDLAELHAFWESVK